MAKATPKDKAAKKAEAAAAKAEFATLTPQQKLKETMSKLKKTYGSNVVSIMSQDVRTNVEATPSDLISLDDALGIYGFPRGRMIELYGPEASGKTTACFRAIAVAQKASLAKGNTDVCACYIDIEHSVDKKWAKLNGVDLDRIFIAQPDSGEEALTILNEFVKTGAFDIIVVDSVAALSSAAEQADGDMSSQQPGVQARLMSKALRMIAGSTSKSRTTILFINQMREKIGVMFGNPETTPGGLALKHYASIRIEVRKGEAIKTGNKDDDQIGQFAKFSIKKNKCASPYKKAEVPLYFDRGYDAEECLVLFCLEHDILTKKGAWISHKGELVGQGTNAVARMLKEQPDKFRSLYEEAKTFRATKITVVENIEDEGETAPALDAEDETEEAKTE
jgi:recombination protein RecA